MPHGGHSPKHRGGSSECVPPSPPAGRVSTISSGSPGSSSDPLAGVLARLALSEAGPGGGSAGQLRRAPIKGPSGPRRQGVGVEEEEQAVVAVEKLPNGGVQLRVTLLAAGFVIGASGASVREISATTGAVVQSWSEGPVSGCHRPSRVFRVQGQRRAVAAAVEIIHEAVERYKELCEGKRRGEFVQRQQRIRGVEFSYQPPPRSVAPHAAALGSPPDGGGAAGGEGYSSPEPEAVSGQHKRPSSGHAVNARGGRANGGRAMSQGNGVPHQQQGGSGYLGMGASPGGGAGHHHHPNAWVARADHGAPGGGSPLLGAHAGAASGSHSQSAMFAAAADQYAYHTHMAAAAAAAASAAYQQQQQQQQQQQPQGTFGGDSLVRQAPGSPYMTQSTHLPPPPGFYQQLQQHQQSVSGGYYGSEYQQHGGEPYDHNPPGLYGDEAVRGGGAYGRVAPQRMGGQQQQQQQGAPHFPTSHSAGQLSSYPGALAPPPRLASPGVPVNEAARLLGSALAGPVLGMSSPAVQQHGSATLLRANGNGSSVSLHHSGGSHDAEGSSGEDVHCSYLSDTSVSLHGGERAMTKTGSAGSIATPPLTPVPPRRVPSTDSLGSSGGHGGLSLGGSATFSAYAGGGFSDAGGHSPFGGVLSSWTAQSAYAQPDSPPSRLMPQQQQQSNSWLRVASSAPAPPGGRGDAY